MSLPTTIVDAAAALRRKELSSRELTTAMLERADRHDATLGCFLYRCDPSALDAADRADRELAGGTDRGPLHGIPLGVKDIFATEDAPTTAQSLVLDPAWGDRGDATAVGRLRAAGAVLMGKTSTMEFAIGLPDRDKPFPVPRNPWDTSKWAGGSSSGTANGTVAGLFYGGLGTDTGGSIRMPSAVCGATGIKPTFGRVSRSGVVPLSASLDHVGPIARTVRDCALLLEAIAGHDPSDPYCADVAVPSYDVPDGEGLAGVRIGVQLRPPTMGPMDDSAIACVRAAVDTLRDAGARVAEIEVPHYEAVEAAHLIVMFGEAFSYHRSDLQRRWLDYGRFTRFMVTTGLFFSAADLAQSRRVIDRLARPAVEELFGRFDVIITPTCGAGAPDAEGLDFVSALGLPVFTAVWNALGLPAMSVPVGHADGGLPVGMQIAGRAFDEPTVLRVGAAFQRLTDHHLRAPAFVAD